MMTFKASCSVGIGIFGLAFCCLTATDADARRKSKKNRTEEVVKSVPKVKTISEKMVSEIGFVKTELSLQDMADDKLRRDHKRKVQRAGLNGRDPLDAFTSHAALALVKEKFERKWGDGIKAENSSSVTMRIHLSGEAVTDTSKATQLATAMDVVYGGENANASLCLAGEDKNIITSNINKSNLRAIKSALGLKRADTTPYRVLTGKANEENIVLKEGIDLSTKQFNVLAELLAKNRPIVVRFVGGTKGASDQEKEEIEETAEKAVAELSKGPRDGILTWSESGKSWSFKHQPARSSSLSKLMELLEKVGEFSLTDGKMGSEYPVFRKDVVKDDPWNVAIIPSDSTNGMMTDLARQFKMTYGYTVEQEVDGCDVRLNVFLNTQPVQLGPSRMSTFAEVADFTLVNTERDHLLTGYLEAPNCTASISDIDRPEVSDSEFDELRDIVPQCEQLCVRAKQKLSSLDPQKCLKDCTESKDFRQCIATAILPISDINVQECQQRLQ